MNEISESTALPSRPQPITVTVANGTKKKNSFLPHSFMNFDDELLIINVRSRHRSVQTDVRQCEKSRQIISFQKKMRIGSFSSTV